MDRKAKVNTDKEKHRQKGKGKHRQKQTDRLKPTDKETDMEAKRQTQR